MTSPDPFEVFALPVPTLAQLSFCNGTKSSQVASWGESLPVNRTAFASAQLYKALPEISQVKTSGQQRLNMLESIRPHAQNAIQSLAKSFASSPLMLPDGAIKSAAVCQALQKHMTTGYLLALKELCQDTKAADQNLLALTAARAMMGMGLQLLRSYELYTAPPPKLWQQAHQLYRIAEQLDISTVSVADPLLSSRSSTTLEQLYFRPLLLASANPNQLTKNEIARVYAALEQWTALVVMDQQHRSDDVYLVELSSNLPPQTELQQQSASDTNTRYLHLSELCKAIEQKIRGELDSFFLPLGMVEATLKHCLSRWQSEHHRKSPRRALQGQVDVVVGLTNIHALLTQEQSIIGGRRKPSRQGTQVQYGSQKLASEYDPWEAAFDAQGNKDRHFYSLDFNDSTETPADTQENPTHTIKLVDASAGGYCLLWARDIIPQVKAGELIALQLSGSNQWLITVIRWVRQTPGGTLMGVQQLGQAARPAMAELIQREGSSSPLRVLLIPENRAQQIGESLVTGSMPFKSGHKATLYTQQHQATIQLKECLISTSGINQFQFRTLEKVGVEPAPGNDDIMSDWK